MANYRRKRNLIKGNSGKGYKYATTKHLDRILLIMKEIKEVVTTSDLIEIGNIRGEYVRTGIKFLMRIGFVKHYVRKEEYTKYYILTDKGREAI